jgi:hypothetical protein
MTDCGFSIDHAVRAEAQGLIERVRPKSMLWALGSSRLRLVCVGDVEAELELAQHMLRDAAAKMSPRFVLPVLIDAIGQCYYGSSDHDELPALGPVLKIALAASWPFVWSDGHMSQHSSDLDWLVGAAQIVEQLQAVRSILSVARDGCVTVDAGGLHAAGAVDDVAKALASAFAPRGQMLRLAAETTRAIIRAPIRVAHGIERVLHGERPDRVAELEECWLSRVPEHEPRAFWKGLQARLLLLALLGQKTGSDVEPTDAIEFSDLVIALGREVDGNIRQTVTRDLFWRREWYARQSPKAHRHLAVDRPALRITRDSPRYCTSIALLGDAVNWFVESSVIRHPAASGVPLSSSCFRTLLSEPFERQVERELRALGFRAARVTTKGTWLIDRPVDLAARIGPPPGEIDVLAMHDSGYVLVIECKVLAMPDTDERLRNLMGKLGEDDSEAIFAKVAAKLDWVRRASLTAGSALHAAVVVLDRPWPGMRFGRDVSVVDLSLLREAVSVMMTLGA